jgi:DNA-binding transcriptional regulator YdaS (Cro superfamily)
MLIKKYNKILVITSGANMTLKNYFKGKPRGSISDMAEMLDVSRTWFSLIINGRAAPSPSLSVTIERLTKGQVTRKTLRPDLF